MMREGVFEKRKENQGYFMDPILGIKGEVIGSFINFLGSSCGMISP